MEEVIVDVVKEQLEEILKSNGVRVTEIKMNNSLVDDFGIDSFGLMDLASGLEKRLNVSRFAMEDWEIGESIKRKNRYTVESLVNALKKEIDVV